MKRTLSLIALLTLTTLSMAQNSALYKAQSAMEKKDYTGALQILQEGLQNPKTTKLAEFQRKIGECNALLFQPQLDLAAKGMPFDTASFYTYLEGAVTAFTKSYEEDMKPDAKGKTKPQFEALNRLNISQMLNYYNYAAIFKFQSGDVRGARDYFIKYYDMPRNIVFAPTTTDSIYMLSRRQYNQAALNITQLSFQLKDFPTTIKYADIALQDTVSLHELYQLKMVSQYQMGDTVAYMQTLKDAVARTGDEVFLQDLTTDYMQRHDREGALTLADEFIAKDPQNKNAYYLKGRINFYMTPYNYEEARANFQKAIDIDPNFAQANADMGNCYFNEVVDKMNNGTIQIPYGQGQDVVKKKMQVLQKEVFPYYNKALPYYEKAKEAAPDKPQWWCQGLYAVYKQLYMDDKANALKAEFPDYCND